MPEFRTEMLTWNDRFYGTSIVLDVEFTIRTPYGYRIAKALRRHGFDGIDVSDVGLIRTFGMADVDITATVLLRRFERANLKTPKPEHRVESNRTAVDDSLLSPTVFVTAVETAFLEQYKSLLRRLLKRTSPSKHVYEQLQPLVQIASDLRV